MTKWYNLLKWKIFFSPHTHFSDALKPHVTLCFRHFSTSYLLIFSVVCESNALWKCCDLVCRFEYVPNLLPKYKTIYAWLRCNILSVCAVWLENSSGPEWTQFCAIYWNVAQKSQSLLVLSACCKQTGVFWTDRFELNWSFYIFHSKFVHLGLSLK